MNNAQLQTKYEEMYSQGPTAWFSDGENERKAILEIGKPWQNKSVLEIGCGEGRLCHLMYSSGALPYGIDYSQVAIDEAQKDPPYLPFFCDTYRGLVNRHRLNGFIGQSVPFDRVVMQGVLEHFDEPWQELDWIIRNLVAPGGDVITSSPCFVNTRGMIWMTLSTLFDAKMSLTDLHFLHPWEFEKFASEHPMVKSMEKMFTDESWGNHEEMLDDFHQRLPKVFPGMESERIRKLLSWLDLSMDYMDGIGATAVYRLKLKEGFDDGRRL